MTNKQELVKQLRAQGKKLREIGETLDEAHKISRQRVWQLEHGNPEDKKYSKLPIRKATKELIVWLTGEFKKVTSGFTQMDMVDFLVNYYLEDEECRCKPNDDMLCPACRKHLKSKEIE